MNVKPRIFDHNLTIVITHDDYKTLKEACYRREESMSMFGRRAICAQMIRMKLLPSKEKAALGV